MAIFDTAALAAKALNAGLATFVILFTAILGRIFYMQKLHPLSKFPGPWYATSFSVVGAIISVLHREPQFFMYLVDKYGSRRSSHFPAQLQLLTLTQRTAQYAYPPQCCSFPSRPPSKTSIGTHSATLGLACTTVEPWDLRIWFPR